MLKTKNDPSEEFRAKAVELFNARLADCIDCLFASQAVLSKSPWRFLREDSAGGDCVLLGCGLHSWRCCLWCTGQHYS
jgi:hypothetical protein